VPLLISCKYPSYLTLNSCFVFVLLLLILYLLILDFIYFALKSVRYIWIDIKNFVSFRYIHKNVPMAVMLKSWQIDCLALKKLQIIQDLLKWLKYSTIQKPIWYRKHLFVYFYIWDSIFTWNFRQYKLRSLPWFFCLNKLSLLIVWTFFSYS
jgi:hypothetical protein